MQNQQDSAPSSDSFECAGALVAWPPHWVRSAFADRHDVKEGMSTGAAHYFTKPLDYGELEDRITDLIPC